MKIPTANDSLVAGCVLLAAAAVLLSVATLTGRNDVVSATLFLGGVGTFLSAVFVLSFAREQPFDAEVASLLSTSSTVNLCRAMADLGVRGDAWFVPTPGSGPVREFVPVAGQGVPGEVPDFTFVTGTGIPGIALLPAAAHLLEYCERTLALIVPQAEGEISAAIRELAVDVLGLAEDVEVEREGESLVLTARGYRLFPGCLAVARESPKCCTMHPCGLCSLAACMLARGTGIPWQVTHVSLDERGKKVTAVFRCLPSPGPTGGGPGNSR